MHFQIFWVKNIYFFVKGTRERDGIKRNTRSERRKKRVSRMTKKIIQTFAHPSMTTTSNIPVIVSSNSEAFAS